jgi:hypothetical protein
MDFNRSLIFPPKLLTGFITGGTTVVTSTYSDASSIYYGKPYRWQVELDLDVQQHSNPNTTTPYSYTAEDVTIGMWIGQNSGCTYQIVSVISVSGLKYLTAEIEDTDLLNLISSPTRRGGNVPEENQATIVFDLDDNGSPILNPIQSQSSQLPDYSYWVHDIESRFKFRNYYQKFFYISPGDNGTGLTGGDPVYLATDSTFIKVDSTSEALVDKIFGFVSGGNLPYPGHLTVMPSGKYVSGLPDLPGATGDVLYLDTVSGTNNLTNIKPSSGPVKPVYIKISQNSGILVTSGGGSGSGGGTGSDSSAAIYQFGTTAGFPGTGATAALYIALDTNEAWYWRSNTYKALSQYDSDITVSLSGGKTLGRYESGETIPATGKTPKEVIELLAQEPIPPTVSLSSPTTVQFNQTAISNVLNFSYTINGLGATVASATLEWRRGGAGAWTTLSTSITTPDTFTHTLTDTNFNTAAFNYRYTVVDSQGSTNTATADITPVSYVAPSVSFTVAGASITSPETNSTREKGNVSSDISGTVTRNSPYVDLVNYTLQYQVNGGGFSSIGSAVSIGPGTTAMTPVNHNPTGDNTASSLGYRVAVVDTYQQYLSSQSYSSTSTVSFYNLIFYGPSSSAPTTSGLVRALANKIFTFGSNPFLLNTGSVEKIFTAAMPASLSITEVLDLDALNANITANYILSTFNVDDDGGTPTSYKIYTMTNAIPYADNHRHQITRS